MKTILEVYPNRQIEHSMLDELYDLIMGAYEQGQAIKSEMTISDVIHHLPIELKVKVKSQIVNRISPDDQSYKEGATAVLYYAENQR